MAQERVQRRLAAILAADAVGYSRLMEADEEGTLERMKMLRENEINPRIDTYGGRIFKTTGDGILVEFPSAVDAVRYAVDLQGAMARLNADAPEDNRIVFRIGISLGDVMIEGDDLFGNGVNVAARMEGLSRAGGICVSGNVQEHIGGVLDVTFEDLGEQSVKNIERPIRCYHVVMKSEDDRPAGAPDLSDKPSIAVLPFENMSADPEQEYFADGIAEDIITALSRFRWFFVIARNSSFIYKGRAIDVKQVADDLGVQYVLEGSVRKVGNRVRITAQLIDAATGRHVWAERYDRELTDIFAVQDEITEAITCAVAPAFTSAELYRADRKAPENLDSWDYALRGNWHLWRCSPEDVAQAKRLFETAIERDRRCAIAYSGLAIACVQEILQGWARDPTGEREKAYRAAKQAVALDDQDAWAHAVHGYIDHLRANDDAALRSLRNAIDLNPNLPFAQGALGLIHAHQGDYTGALFHADKAARLSPRDPTNVVWVVARAVASFSTERCDEHLQWSKSLTEAVPYWPIGWRHLVVAFVNLDRLDDARNALRELHRLVPHETIDSIRLGMAHFRPAQLERFLDALKKAGLPEAPTAEADIT